ncbi:MAG: hypothetical protein ACI8QG_001672 [Flavobacteriales bacterium]|jgi:hypothetical protein
MNNVVLVVGVSLESLGMLNVAFNNQGCISLETLNDAQAFSIAEKLSLIKCCWMPLCPKWVVL